MALRLGDILVEKGLISKDDLSKALDLQQNEKTFLGQVLVVQGLVVESDLLEALSEQQGLSFVKLRDRVILDSVVRLVPAKFVRHYTIMPISFADEVLTIAVSNPFDMWPVDDLESNLGYRVERVLATSADIAECIQKHYGVAADTIERILTADTATEIPEDEETEDLERMAENASVVKVVNQILQEAIRGRATDIHFERFRGEVRLRYRIDGILRGAPVSENIRYLYPAVISRIKILSGLDIIERRLPQDGRGKVKVGGKEYDLRISVMPTMHGENVVIRVLPTTMMFDLTDLGLAAADRETLESLIHTPHGILFVTGPTGSGKSTTLYACLSQLNQTERKVVTIEDPVEYELAGVSQVQVNTKIGLDFARTLRSMLRHDPDVIMVGEIRDAETASIANRAALTGHLVLSTLHTNDAASGVTRLVDIGLEPYLVASSVRAFLAQRLVRKVCSHCAQEMSMDPDVLAQFEYKGKRAAGSIKYRKGLGCDECGHTGYLGRTAIYEILLVDDKIRRLITEKTSADIIKSAAINAGMQPLRSNGFQKILDGVTTPEEVLRVTALD
jgi:type II secretory ATPase GspE/PulE/Tfp pilus assembly ATPase PilB-like protein